MSDGRWHRRGKRVYEFLSKDNSAQSMIFGAPLPSQLWAWAVWGEKFKAEGVEFSLASARKRAREHLAKLMRDVREDGAA
jgi:hypothetical protein